MGHMEHLLTNVLPKDVADNHLSGDLHISNPVSGLAYELVADWDATVKLEIVEALRSIVPAAVRSSDGGARGSAADHSG